MERDELEDRLRRIIPKEIHREAVPANNEIIPFGCERCSKLSARIATMGGGARFAGLGLGFSLTSVPADRLPRSRGRDRGRLNIAVGRQLASEP